MSDTQLSGGTGPKISSFITVESTGGMMMMVSGSWRCARPKPESVDGPGDLIGV